MANKITIILGTAREGRQSEKVANYIYQTLQSQENLEAKIVDVKDYLKGETVAPWQENSETEKWKQVVKNTDAFIIVCPEYNHSYPGELKNVLDQDLKNYDNKPAIIAGVSAGSFGGTRAVEQLTLVLFELGLKVLPYHLFFPNVEEEFVNSSEYLDDKYLKHIETSVKKLLKNI